MEVAPLPCITPKELISQSFEINQENKIYKLNIKVENNQTISMNLSEEKELFEEYEVQIN